MSLAYPNPLKTSGGKNASCQVQPRPAKSLSRPACKISGKGCHQSKQVMTKKFVWIGMFVGSAIGNMLPTLWGGDAISFSGVLLSLAGGVIGIWVGYRIGQAI